MTLSEYEEGIRMDTLDAYNSLGVGHKNLLQYSIECQLHKYMLDPLQCAPIIEMNTMYGPRVEACYYVLYSVKYSKWDLKRRVFSVICPPW